MFNIKTTRTNIFIHIYIVRVFLSSQLHGKVEEYRDFSLDLVGDFTRGLHLTDLFDHFFREETLELNCERCSSK
jgi:hypothetical protein